jgi:transposase-like protein
MTESKMYTRHRFPPEIIQYAVWLYHRFSVSHRDIEDLLAQRGLLPEVIHNTQHYASNRAELSHQPTRVRERGMRKFKSVEQAQRFLSAHASIDNLFNLGRHLLSAENYRYFRLRAFASWEKAAAL